jgi:hypothetical protein
LFAETPRAVPRGWVRGHFARPVPEVIPKCIYIVAKSSEWTAERNIMPREEKIVREGGTLIKITDTANLIERAVGNAKATAELPDGTKGVGQSFKNDAGEAERNAVFNAFQNKAGKR